MDILMTLLQLDITWSREALRQHVRGTVRDLKEIGESQETGDQGLKGDRGTQGPKGDRGYGGEVGLQGLKGDRGDHGPSGYPGVQGPKGSRGYTGSTGYPGPKGNDAGGVVYVRWGHTDCPTNTGAQRVYRGVVGGSHYRHSGGGSNPQCLPCDPRYPRDYNYYTVTGKQRYSCILCICSTKYRYNTSTRHAGHFNIQKANLFRKKIFSILA